MSTLETTWSEDQRQELAAFAARSERQNQPRHLMILAAAILVGALVYFGLSWRAYAVAQGKLAHEREVTANVVKDAGRLRALEAATENAGPKVSDPTDTILTSIDRAGVEAGVTSNGHLPLPLSGNPLRPNGSNSAQSKWTYTIKNPSLSALLNFTERATGAVPGLEVYSVRVRPEATMWELVVTFARWERADKPS